MLPTSELRDILLDLRLQCMSESDKERLVSV